MLRLRVKPVLGISVALLRPLAELLGKLGVDPTQFLREVGVDEAMAPETYVDGDVVDRRLEAIAAVRRDPALALTLATHAVARPLGLFGHMVWLSGTVRDALTRATKFYAMVTQRSTLRLDEERDTAWVRMPPARKQIARGRVLVEFPFASLAMRAREATGGRFKLRAVRFTHAGEATPAYAEVFGVPVAFGAAVDEVELDAAMLDLRLASDDPITAAALEANVAARIARPTSPFVDRARRVIAGIDCPPTLTAVARGVGVSARTLRRRLEEEGQSLRAVVDDVRRERADTLLGTGTPIKEVAFALGFSEPSAFSRAYKRWTGRAPKLGR